MKVDSNYMYQMIKNHPELISSRTLEKAYTEILEKKIDEIAFIFYHSLYENMRLSINEYGSKVYSNLFNTKFSFEENNSFFNQWLQVNNLTTEKLRNLLYLHPLSKNNCSQKPANTFLFTNQSNYNVIKYALFIYHGRLTYFQIDQIVKSHDFLSDYNKHLSYEDDNFTITAFKNGNHKLKFHSQKDANKFYQLLQLTSIKLTPVFIS